MKDTDTDEELEFQFNKWLSKDKEDNSQLCYKAPAERNGEASLKGMILMYVVTLSRIV